MLGKPFADGTSTARSSGGRWGLVSAVWLLVLGSSAVAETSRLKNAQLCNGADGGSVESQIKGCSALIESGDELPRVLAVAYNNRGNAHLKNDDYVRAIQDYDKAIAILPNYALALNNRAVALQKIGQSDLAIQDLDRAIKLNGSYANAFANRAEIHLETGDHKRALADYDVAIRLQPTANRLNGRCRVQVIVGELQAGLPDCNEAARLESKFTPVFDTRGLAYLKSGQWDLAIAEYNRAITLSPKLASALYGRGVAQLRKGMTEQGQADLAMARSIDPRIEEEFRRFGIQ